MEIINKTVFDIVIEDKIEGNITIAGHALLGSKQLIHNSGSISPLSKGSLTIEQRLNPDEVSLVAKCKEEVFGAIFYFDKLGITVKEGTQFPRYNRVSLKLREFENACSKDSRERAEIEAKELQKLESNIEHLTFVLGMVMQARLIYDSGQAITKSNLQYLNNFILETLNKCFDDDKIIEEYFAKSPPVPDEVKDQQLWFRSHRDELSDLIHKQRELKSKSKQK